MLSRDQLFSSFERRYTEVPTRIGAARIQNLSEGEREEIDAGGMNADGSFNLPYIRTKPRRWVAAVLVDADGKRLLNSSSDIDRLLAVDAAIVQTIYVAALEHCGTTEIDAEKKDSAAVAGDSPAA